ncbi:MAG: hypothetical protein QOG80_809 [Pseudonocardiales bacterium]|jgi:uncharacterized cupredoxin-like copper-binding protein|nr:hypothetical protein [Pseudonocardiales bacterium]
MATLTPDRPSLDEQHDYFDEQHGTVPAASSLELLSLQDEVRRQGRSIKDTQRAFTIFAVVGLVLAMCTFLAVVFKLDAKSTTAAAPVGATAPAARAPAAASPVHSVSVDLREFVVANSSKTAAAGKVTFAVHNTGAVPHEFVVLRTDKPASALLKGKRADETGNVGETGDLAVGKSKTLHLTLKPGHYALICNLPGHYQAGQHTDFTVK